MTDNALSPQHRRTIRLRHYDYASAGAYFVTICTHLRSCIFGEIVDGRVILNTLGKIAETCWLMIPDHFVIADLDTYVIMPNHMHGIVVINTGVGARHALPLRQPRTFGKPPAQALSSIVGSYKSAVTKRIHDLQRSQGQAIWQRNYYEHVIRTEHDLARIVEYITLNPLQWADDENHPDHL